MALNGGDVEIRGGNIKEPTMKAISGYPCQRWRDSDMIVVGQGRVRVDELQQALIRMADPEAVLQRWGADGRMGRETAEAIRFVAARLKMDANGQVSTYDLNSIDQRHVSIADLNTLAGVVQARTKWLVIKPPEEHKTMTTADTIRAGIKSGAHLAAAQKANELITGAVSKALEEAGVPKALLDNPLAKPILGLAAPALLLYAIEWSPKQIPAANTIARACQLALTASSATGVVAIADLVMKHAKPVFKQLKALDLAAIEGDNGDDGDEDENGDG